MRIVMRCALATLLLVAATVLPADAAWACSCARNPTAEGILQGATAVFTGVAGASLQVAPGRSITTFTLSEAFKGAAAGTTLRVSHPSGSSASCGVTFRPGETHTLAAYRTEEAPGLATSLCSTWMFLPSVGIGADLISRMRVLRGGR
jgi:hypothetical protein